MNINLKGTVSQDTIRPFFGQKSLLKPSMNRQNRFRKTFRFHEDIREKRVQLRGHANFVLCYRI